MRDTQRSVAECASYMDAGQFATLAEVLDHHNRAPATVSRTLSGLIVVSEPAPGRRTP